MKKVQQEKMLPSQPHTNQNVTQVAGVDKMTKIEKTIKALEAIQSEWRELNNNEHRHWWFVIAVNVFTAALKETGDPEKAKIRALLQYKEEKNHYYSQKEV